MRILFILSVLLIAACNGTAETGYLEKPIDDTSTDKPESSIDTNTTTDEATPDEVTLVDLKIFSQDNNLRRAQNSGYELKLGNSAKFKAIGIYSDGSQQDLTDQVQWQTSQPSLLRQSVDEAKAVATGEVKVSAQLDDLSSNELDLSIIPIKKVVTWGNPNGGARIDEETQKKLIDVVDVVASFDGFSALKANGEVITWGSDISANRVLLNETEIVDQLDNIQMLYSPPIDTHYSPYSSNQDFFGKTKDGTYSSWNRVQDMNLLRISINDIQSDLINVNKIYSTKGATAALKEDGTVVTWGSTVSGGDSANVQDELHNIVSITANDEAFAALKEDGTVVTWGATIAGGTGFILDMDFGNYIYVKNELTNIKSIVSNEYSFAALKQDGSVVSWGLRIATIPDSDENPNNNRSYNYGGDSTPVQHKLTNIKKIYPAGYAYAALKEDGTVVTWGEPSYGGYSEHLQTSEGESKLQNIQDIVGNIVAFAALKEDGSVISWGQEEFGGKIDINHDTISDELTGVKRIFSNRLAFAALKEDGSVVAWGQPEDGGLLDINDDNHVDEVTNVKEIYASGHGFTALKEDGTIVTWGEHANNNITRNLTHVIDIKSNIDGFAALVEVHEIEP